jgi:hypothetical protein
MAALGCGEGVWGRGCRGPSPRISLAGEPPVVYPFCRNLQEVSFCRFLQKGYTSCRNLQKWHTSCRNLQKVYPLCRNLQKVYPLCRFLQKSKISAEIYREGTPSAKKFVEILDFCRAHLLHISAESVPLPAYISTEICRKVHISAEILNFCNFCRNLRFLQKGAHFLQKF